jgi:hypothetical protein
MESPKKEEGPPQVPLVVDKEPWKKIVVPDKVKITHHEHIL